MLVGVLKETSLHKEYSIKNSLQQLLIAGNSDKNWLIKLDGCIEEVQEEVLLVMEVFNLSTTWWETNSLQLCSMKGRKKSRDPPGGRRSRNSSGLVRVTTWLRTPWSGREERGEGRGERRKGGREGESGDFSHRQIVLYMKVKKYETIPILFYSHALNMSALISENSLPFI